VARAVPKLSPPAQAAAASRQIHRKAFAATLLIRMRLDLSSGVLALKPDFYVEVAFNAY
jgi:hypothetical protein